MEVCTQCEGPMIEGRCTCDGKTVGWFLYCALCGYCPDDVESPIEASA